MNSTKTDYESIQGLVVPEPSTSDTGTETRRQYFSGAGEERSGGERSSICSTSSRGYKIKRWLGIRRSTWLLSLYIIAYFVYLLGGCMMFACLETDLEENIKEFITLTPDNILYPSYFLYFAISISTMTPQREIHLRKEKFLSDHPDVEQEELENLLEDILFRGISPRRRDLNRQDGQDPPYLLSDQYIVIRSNWSFGQSFLFTVTVVTTIGYGHIYPITATGKAACILYAVIGIPFTLIFLSALVQRLLAPTFKLLSSFIKMLPNMDTLQVRLIHLALMGSVYLLLSILLPTLFFYIIEPDWTFLDGLYFVFISLTTIGLGDYIPGDHPDMATYQTFYKTCVGLFLLFGLILTSLTLTVFYDIPQLNLGLHLHRHRQLCEHVHHPLTSFFRDIFAEDFGPKIKETETQSVASNQTQTSNY